MKDITFFGAEGNKKNSMTKWQGERVRGNNDFVGDKFFMQQMMKIPSNGWEDPKFNDDNP